MAERICQICGTVFTSLARARKACSPECSRKLYLLASKKVRERMKAERRGQGGGMGVTSRPVLDFDPYESADFFGYCFDGRAMRPAAHAIMCPVV